MNPLSVRGKELFIQYAESGGDLASVLSQQDREYCNNLYRPLQNLQKAFEQAATANDAYIQAKETIKKAYHEDERKYTTARDAFCQKISANTDDQEAVKAYLDSRVYKEISKQARRFFQGETKVEDVRKDSLLFWAVSDFIPANNADIKKEFVMHQFWTKSHPDQEEKIKSQKWRACQRSFPFFAFGDIFYKASRGIISTKNGDYKESEEEKKIREGLIAKGSEAIEKKSQDPSLSEKVKDAIDQANKILRNAGELTESKFQSNSYWDFEAHKIENDEAFVLTNKTLELKRAQRDLGMFAIDTFAAALGESEEEKKAMISFLQNIEFNECGPMRKTKAMYIYQSNASYPFYLENYFSDLKKKIPEKQEEIVVLPFEPQEKQDPEPGASSVASVAHDEEIQGESRLGAVGLSAPVAALASTTTSASSPPSVKKANDSAKPSARRPWYKKLGSFFASIFKAPFLALKRLFRRR